MEESYNRHGRHKGEIMSINNAPTPGYGGTGAPATDQQELSTGSDAQAQNGGPSFIFLSQGGTSIGGDSELPNVGISRAQSVGQFVTPKSGGNQKINNGPINLSNGTHGSNGNQHTQPNRESKTEFLDFSANRQESKA